MDDKGRFLHLEKERTQPAEEEVHLEAAARFGAVEGPGSEVPSPLPSPSGASRARFESPGQAQVELASVVAEEQPFIRCAACRIDNGRFATACSRCGADLSTGEQRAFNERLWGAQCKALAEERARELVLDQQRTQDAVETSRRERELAEALAREAGARAREELGCDPDLGSIWSSSWGLRLVRAIPTLPLRVIALAVPISSSIALIQYSAPHSMGYRVGMGLLVALVALFMPRGLYRNRRYGWSGWGGRGF